MPNLKLPDGVRMLLGLDFDNTLICYDHLFYTIALERGLIPASTPAEKNAVRNTLRRQNQEDEWTRFQGEVYGARLPLSPAPFCQ